MVLVLPLLPLLGQLKHDRGKPAAMVSTAGCSAEAGNASFLPALTSSAADPLAELVTTRQTDQIRKNSAE
jgi:hypothetical protein